MIDPTKLMRGAVLALAILLAAPFAGLGGPLFGVEAAQAQTVNRLQITGNEAVDDGAIANRLTIGIGDVATQEELSASTIALESTGLFSSVNVTFGGGTLRVAVRENPVIAVVLFEGNQRFSDEQMVQMISTASRGSYTPETVARDEETIRLAYADAGYQNVTVSSRIESTGEGRTRVIFVVNEGARAGIVAINFTGNEHINSGTLESILKTKRSNILSFLFRDDVYTEDGLQLDEEIVRLYYANHGYPDAQVNGVAEYDDARLGYFISFTIVEGDLYTIGNVDIEHSIAGLNPDALRSTIRTYQGQRYAFDDLARTVEDMAYEATAQGFAFADVRPRIDRDIANRVFNITYLVDEGARIYVERIEITGNEKTRDFVIRREFDFAEGDPFNRALVQRGKANIEALGFFRAVNVSVTNGSTLDKVVINVSVVEQSTGDYGATAGYSSQDGILGEVSLTERNFLGRGQYLRIAIGVSQSGRTFDLSFTEPRFLGLRIAAGVDAYHRIQDETTVNFYGLTTTGGQLRATVPLTRDLSATLLVGGERKVLADSLLYDHDSDPATAPIPHPTAFGDSNIVNDGDTFMKTWVGYTLTYAGVDDLKHPTEGLYATLTQQYVGWDHNFLKTEVRARYFVPLLEDSGFVGSIRGQAGIINDFSGAGLHALEAFRLGPTLVRGFEFQGLGPRLTTGEYLGATMYAGGSVEIDFPIPIIPENYGIRGAIWGDAAYVSGVPSVGTGTLDPLTVDQNLKASVGVSVIWDGPFGPVRGDFAQVLSRATNDRTQVFQLSIQNLI